MRIKGNGFAGPEFPTVFAASDRPGFRPCRQGGRSLTSGDQRHPKDATGTLPAAFRGARRTGETTKPFPVAGKRFYPRQEALLILRGGWIRSGTRRRTFRIPYTCWRRLHIRRPERSLPQDIRRYRFRKRYCYLHLFFKQFSFCLKLCSKINDANIKLLSERVKRPQEIYRERGTASSAVFSSTNQNALRSERSDAKAKNGQGEAARIVFRSAGDALREGTACSRRPDATVVSVRSNGLPHE